MVATLNFDSTTTTKNTSDRNPKKLLSSKFHQNRSTSFRYTDFFPFWTHCAPVCVSCMQNSYFLLGFRLRPDTLLLQNMQLILSGILCSTRSLRESLFAIKKFKLKIFFLFERTLQAHDLLKIKSSNNKKNKSKKKMRNV